MLVRLSKLISLLLILSTLALTLGSCQKEAPPPEKVTETKLKVSDFNFMGKWHNAFLSNVHDNFEIPKTRSSSEITKEEGLNILLDFNKSFARESASQYLPEEFLHIDMNSMFDKFYNLADIRTLSTAFFSQSVTRSATENDIVTIDLRSILLSLENNEEISDFTYGLFLELKESLQQNYDHTLSNADLKEKINQLIKKVDEHGYNKESVEGTLVASIFAISAHSLDFWENNPDLLSKDTRVAPWVAADIAGAIIGGTIGVISSAGGNGGEINWKSVAISAGGGAITGSTGLVGKAAKFLRMLF